VFLNSVLQSLGLGVISVPFFKLFLHMIGFSCDGKIVDYSVMDAIVFKRRDFMKRFIIVQVLERMACQGFSYFESCIIFVATVVFYWLFIFYFGIFFDSFSYSFS
jgi:hypothetical protein